MKQSCESPRADLSSRRELLRRAGMGFGSLALAGLLDQQGLAVPRTAVSEIKATSPLAQREPHFAAKAKSVIWILLSGGPSQVDTWDYKPELQKRDGQKLGGADPKTGFFTTSGKLLKSPFEFKRHGLSGTWVSEIFPHLANHVDQMAFIHSCYSESNNHSPALFHINTGLNRMGFPCVGSWITYGLGTENEDMPGFVVMTDALGRGLPKGKAFNWGAGFLPGVYQGTRLNNESPAIDNLFRLSIQSATQQRRLLDALETSNREHQQRYTDETDLTADRIVRVGFSHANVRAGSARRRSGNGNDLQVVWAGQQEVRPFWTAMPHGSSDGRAGCALHSDLQRGHGQRKKLGRASRHSKEPLTFCGRS